MIVKHIHLWYKAHMALNESETVRFNFRGKNHALTLSSGVFDFFNRGALDVHACDLVQLSAENSTAAYRYLRSAVANFASEKSLDISMDGKIVAHASFEDVGEVRKLARRRIQKLMPMEYDGPFSMTVGIFADAAEIEQGIISPDGIIEVMTLEVEPPSLAA
jgi:hypothetical protein